MKELIKHYKEQIPVLDNHGMFMFFSNNKVAQTSINRHLLKSRCIVYKDNHDKYESYFQAMVDKMDSTYKFTIVRNPWDRAVSAFTYLKIKVRTPSLRGMLFHSFVLKVLQKKGTQWNAHFDHQHPKAFYKGSCFVDFIGRLENIESDWKVIARSISAPVDLPHKNKSYHDDYSKYYKPESIEVIRNLYSEDIEKFGYSFEDGI